MLTKLRGGGGDNSCYEGNQCPTLHRHDDGSIVVQGYTTAVRTMVSIPVNLAPEWDVPDRRRGDELLITGRLVTDPQLLAELDLPAGESAVIVQPTDLPALAAVMA